MPTPEGRHLLRPDDSGVIMIGLDQGADEAGDADAIGTAHERPLDAVGPGDQRPHRLRIFVAEIEDLADLDAAPVDALSPRRLARESRRVMDILGRGIKRSPFLR